MFAVRQTIVRVAAFAVAACWVADATAQTVAELTPAPAATTILAPTDPMKLAAFRVLETHCSRCHQADRLVGRSKVAKGFGNILDLDALAQNPKYVKPGDADHSLIYHVIVRQEMPSDVFQDGDLDHPAPSDQDLKTLRAWIAGLKPIEVASLPHADERLPALPSSPEPGAPPADAPPPVVPVVPPVVVTTPAPAKVDPDLIMVAQVNLIRLGCFDGQPSGIADAATSAAIARYNATLGRGDQATAISPELVEEMKSQDGRVCGQRPVIASLPGPDETLSPPVVETHPPVKTEDQPAPARETRPAAKIEAKPARREAPAKVVPPHHTETASLEEQPKPTRRAPPPPAAKPHVAHEQPAERKAAPPPHKIARDVPLRQPVTRQAQRQQPAYKQATRQYAPAAPSGGGGGGGGASMQGMSGI